ncbi:histidine triad nucleotide-binding protein [Vampirovibrio sp.]|uniref:histidine triad nucleotide-binding protein n=1 Tax=Vampirovibrio sp. TaxID=2717857 RepID=UPI003593D1CB
MTADCLFCNILAGNIPCQKLGETKTVLAFSDINPQAPTHALVIHKTHTASLSETNENQLLGELLGGARDVAQQLELGDYRLVINNGAAAGQSVFHLHAHILAGRPLKWPPG